MVWGCWCWFCVRLYDCVVAVICCGFRSLFVGSLFRLGGIFVFGVVFHAYFAILFFVLVRLLRVHKRRQEPRSCMHACPGTNWNTP